MKFLRISEYAWLNVALIDTIVVDGGRMFVWRGEEKNEVDQEYQDKWKELMSDGH